MTVDIGDCGFQLSCTVTNEYYWYVL